MEKEPLCFNPECKLNSVHVPKDSHSYVVYEKDSVASPIPDIFVNAHSPYASVDTKTVTRHLYIDHYGHEFYFCSTCKEAVSMVYGVSHWHKKQFDKP
jgi:hypothetical protein